jgi:hypothetical protein
MAEPQQEPFDENDNFERGKVSLTPAERAAREAEKKQLLQGHVIPSEGGPSARRIRPGMENTYPDQVAQHEPDPPSQAELAAEREEQRVGTVVEIRRQRIPGETRTIEALAAQVREDEERLKESKALLKRALKKLGVRG